jgi:hypothetical protein
LERFWHIEHDDVVRVVGKNALHRAVPHRLRPVFEQFADLVFVAHEVFPLLVLSSRRTSETQIDN